MSYLALAKEAVARLKRAGGEGGLRVSETPPGLTSLLAMPLDVFSEQGVPLEIRVPWHGQTLWFVPSDRDAEVLEREGITRGRIWTGGELMNLLALPNLSADAVLSVALAKLEFSGAVISARALERPETTAGR